MILYDNGHVWWMYYYDADMRVRLWVNGDDRGLSFVHRNPSSVRRAVRRFKWKQTLYDTGDA